MALIWQPVSLVALAMAVFIGLKFPDIDQRAGFLLHRSIITHGPLLPLMALAISLGDNPVQRRLGAGIGIGFAIHMAFDLFPKSWQGYALISLPVYGWTSSVFSWVWVSATMILCFSIAIKLCRSYVETAIGLLAAIAAFAYAAPGENALWRPLAVATASIVLCYWMVGPDKASASDQN